MKRREFTNWMGLGLIASYFPLALAACSQTEAEAESNTDSFPEFKAIGSASKLQQDGFILDEAAKVLVVESNGLMAVNPTCTHQGCIVEWQADADTFVCPCHNAKYASDGKVLAKPAPSALDTYEVKEEDGTILVEIS